MENPQQRLRSRQEEIARRLRTCPLFLDWPADRLRELAGQARMRRHPRGMALATRESQRRETLVVVSGSVEISATNPGGDKYTLAVLGPGQITGLVFLLDDIPARFTRHAREDSQIIHIPCAALRQVLDAEPILWRGVAQLTLRRHFLDIEGLEGQVLGPLRRRIAVILLNLAHSHGERHAEIAPRHTELRVSQADLSNMLGVSRQTISKELAALRDEGILGDSDGYRQITLLDMPGLLRIAGEN